MSRTKHLWVVRALATLFLTTAACGMSIAGEGEDQLSSTRELIQTKGARLAVERLYAEPTRWKNVLRSVESGDTQWIEVGATLYRQADAGAREMLAHAFGEALARSPDKLLSFASKNQIAVTEFCISPDVDDDRYGTKETALRAMAKRRAAVSAVSAHELISYKEQCLTSLDAATKQLRQFYEGAADK